MMYGRDSKERDIESYLMYLWTYTFTYEIESYPLY